MKPEIASEVISPAYDLYSHARRLEVARALPRSFLNATLSEEDLPDLDLEQRRTRALDYLRRELEGETWQFGDERLAVLRLEGSGHVQTGVVGDVPTTAFPGVILPHEDTRPSRVADLADYLRSVAFGSSPVGLTYRRQPAIDAIVTGLTERQPDLDVTLTDGDRQTVWVVDNESDRESLMEAFSQVASAYIIDGHHRVAATIQRGGDPGGPAGRFLAVAFPDDDLVIYPFHRWVDAALAVPSPVPDPAGTGLEPSPGVVVVVTREGEWAIELPVRAGEEDVSALARTILGPRLGIADERTDPRISFVPGFPDSSGLRAIVAERGGTGFLVHPATVAAVMAVSDRHGVMPPKATFFTPKPRSGLFLVKR